MNNFVSKLTNSNITGTFLGIKPVHRKEFFQVTADGTGAQINFPLITDEQKALEHSVRQVASSISLPIRETRGSDGSRFLDMEMDGGQDEITIMLKTLLSEVFSVDAATELEYRHWGINLKLGLCVHLVIAMCATTDVISKLIYSRLLAEGSDYLNEFDDNAHSISDLRIAARYIGPSVYLCRNQSRLL